MARRILRRLNPTTAPGVTAMAALAASLAGATGERRTLDKLVADLVAAAGATGPTGHVVLEPGRRDGQLRLRLVIANDTPGAHRAWRIRPITPSAAPAAAAAVRINAKGNGVAVATLDALALPSDVPLVVELLTDTPDATVLAIGALA
jgi:hypothetical protein